MTITFRDACIRQLDGKLWFCLQPSDPTAARRFVATKKHRTYDAALKEHREKRSLDANAYFWKLLSDLSAALNLPKEELYLGYVQEVGVYRDFTLTTAEAKTFRTAWEMLGTGWPTEQVDYTPDGEKVVIRAYFGSSQYNTKQMSRLIDTVVQDCKALGIETLPPAKLAAMMEDWRCTK